MGALLVAINVVLALSAPAQAAIPAIANDTWQPDGKVYTVEPSLDGRYVYLGGMFDYLGPSTGSSVKVTDTNAISPSWPTFKGGNVFAMVSDGVGGWYVGGSFTNVDGYVRQRVVHVYSWGSVDPTFNAGTITGGTAVTSLALSTDRTKLYIGGDFTTIGGSASGAEYLAELNATTGAINRGFNRGFAGGTVTSLAWHGGYLYVAGTFGTYESNGRPYLMRTTSTGALDPWLSAGGQSPNGVVRDLVVHNDELFVAGEFTTIAGGSRGRGASFNLSVPATPVLSTWDPRANGVIASIDASATHVAVGGEFSAVNVSTSRERIAVFTRGSLTPVGGNIGANVRWSGPVAEYVRDVDISNAGNVRVGGNFDRVNGIPMIGAFEFVPGATTPNAWRPRIGGGVTVIADDGTSTIVGGTFSSAGGVMRQSLAKVDLATGRPTTWAPQLLDDNALDEAIYDIVAAPNNTVLVGGASFLSTTSPLKALDPNTGLELPGQVPMLTGPSSVVKDIAVYSTKVYVAGKFSGPTVNLARFDLGSTGTDGWNPNVVGGQVNAIDMDGTNVFAVGTFTSIGAPAGLGPDLAGSVGVASPATGAWNPNPDVAPTSVAMQSATAIYIAGPFTSPQARYARTTSNGALAPGTHPTFNGEVTTVRNGPDGMYVAGDFTQVNGSINRPKFASLETDGLTVSTSWFPNPPAAQNWNEALDIARVGSYVFVGGRNGLGVYEVLSDTLSPYAKVVGISETAAGTDPSDRTYVPAGSPSTVFVKTDGAGARPRFTVRANAYDRFSTATAVESTYDKVSGLDRVDWGNIGAGAGTWSTPASSPAAPRGLKLRCFTNSTLAANPGEYADGYDRVIGYSGVTGSRPDQLPSVPATLIRSMQPYDDAADGATSFELVSCRWAGHVIAPNVGSSTTYRFLARGDNGIRVTLGGIGTIIDSWGAIADPAIASLDVSVDPNTSRPIEVDWNEGNNGAFAELSWSSPLWSQTIVPEAAFVTDVDYERTYVLVDPGGATSGTTVAYATPVDRFGNNGPAAGFQVVVDNNPPNSTAMSVDLPYGPGTYSTATVANLSVGISNDNAVGNSGIASRSLEYRTAALLAGDCSTSQSNWTGVPGWNGTTAPPASVTSGTCYQYRIVVTDNLGNTTINYPTAQSLTTNWIRVDTTAPTGGVVSTPPARTTTGQAALSWSAPDDAESNVTYQLAANVYVLGNDGCAGLAGTHTFAGVGPASGSTFTLPTDGRCYEFFLQMTNGAGTVTTSPGTTTWTKYDGTPPNATMTLAAGPTGGIVPVTATASDLETGLNSVSITYDGPTTHDGTLCTATAPGSSWTSSASCNFDTTNPVTTPDGSYTLTFTAANVGGTTPASVSRTVVIDNTAPTITDVDILPGGNPGAMYVVDDDVSAPTAWVRWGSAGDLTVRTYATDANGVADVSYPGLGTGWSAGAIVSGASPFDRSYTWSTAATTPGPGTLQVIARHMPTPSQQSTSPFTINLDSSQPANGNVTHGTSGIPDVAYSGGTDTGSGVGKVEVMRRSAPVDGAGNCPTLSGPFSSFLPAIEFAAPNIAGTWQDTSVQRGFCYEWQLRVTDRVGNVGDFPSGVTYKAPAVGVIVQPVPGATATAVEGGTTQLDVSLRAAPTGTNTVTVTYLGDGQVGPATAQSLTFTHLNWATPQRITVTAVDDQLDEPDASPAHVRFQATSADTEYVLPSAADLTVLVDDNDTPGILTTVAATGLNAAEGGPAATYGVRLATQPHGTVTVALANSAQATATAASTLSFDGTNWSQPKLVTVAAVDDADIEGAHNAVITNSTGAGLSAADSGYANLTRAVPVSITDNDAGGFFVDGPQNPELSEADPAKAGAARIWLKARPTSDVTITMAAANQVTTSGPVTFNAANWSQPQVITFHAANDTVAEPPSQQVVGTLTATSADPNFANLAPITGPVTVLDDDTAAFVTAPGPTWKLNDEGQLLLDESATEGAILRIRAMGDPTSDITITPVAAPAEQLVISPATQKIPAGSHEQVVAFSVRAVNDREKELDPHPAKITWKVTTSDPLYGAAAIPVTVARIKDGESTSIRDTTPDPKPDPTPDPDATTNHDQGGTTPPPTNQTTGDSHPDRTDPQPGTPTDDTKGAPGQTIADDSGSNDETAGGSTTAPKRATRAKAKTKNPAKRLKNWASENKGKASVAASAAGTAAIWGAKPLALAGKALMSGGGGMPGHPPGMGQLRHLFKRKNRARIRRLWRGKRRDLDDYTDDDDWDDFLWGNRAA